MNTPACIRPLLAAASAALLTSCAIYPGGGSTSRSVIKPHEQSLRLRQPPEAAARCFARNAEEHSSALVSEVRAGSNRSEVTVRVKNGLVYALATFDRAGSGSTAAVTLNVTTSGSMSDLLAELTEGC